MAFMNDCEDTQCKQVHRLLDSLLGFMGHTGSLTAPSAAKSAILVQLIRELQEQKQWRTDALKDAHDTKGDNQTRIRRMYTAAFTIRALRLLKRLDDHCRDQGLDAYLPEWDTWNADYASDVKLLMGEAFEIMRLRNFAAEKGLLAKLEDTET